MALGTRGITKNKCDLEPRFAVMDIFRAHRKGFYSLSRGVLRRAGRLTPGLFPYSWPNCTFADYISQPGSPSIRPPCFVDTSG